MPAMPGALPGPVPAASAPVLLPLLPPSRMLQVGAFGRAYVRSSMTVAPGAAPPAAGGAAAAAAAETSSVWRLATTTQLGLPQGAEGKQALRRLTTADGDFTLAYSNLCIIHGCARAMHPGGVVCPRAKNKLAHSAASKKELADKREGKAKRAEAVARSAPREAGSSSGAQ